MHNPDAPLLIGDVKYSDVVKEIFELSYIDRQQKLILFIFLTIFTSVYLISYLFQPLV